MIFLGNGTSPEACAAAPMTERAAPKAPMTRRTRGREIALQVLYQARAEPRVAPPRKSPVHRAPAAASRSSASSPEPDRRGPGRTSRRIDALISEVAENWRLDRMAAIDRNILRLGAYEMLYCPDVPTKVAINEALELAKRYSTAQSSRFVNGILDRLPAAESPRPSRRGGPPTPSRARRRPARATRSSEATADQTPAPRPIGDRASRRRSRARHRQPPQPTGRRPTCTSTPPIPTASARPCEVVTRPRPRRPDGAGDHRPRHPLGHRRRPARGGAAGRGADRRGRADGRARRAARSTSSATSSATTTRRFVAATDCAPRRAGRSASGDGRPARRDCGLRSTSRPSASLSRARLSAAATWPTGWCGRDQVADHREAFARYLGDGGPAQVPKPRLALDRGDRPDPGRGRGCRPGPSAL